MLITRLCRCLCRGTVIALARSSCGATTPKTEEACGELAGTGLGAMGTMPELNKLPELNKCVLNLVRRPIHMHGSARDRRGKPHPCWVSTRLEKSDRHIRDRGSSSVPSLKGKGAYFPRPWFTGSPCRTPHCLVSPLLAFRPWAHCRSPRGNPLRDGTFRT